MSVQGYPLNCPLLGQFNLFEQSGVCTMEKYFFSRLHNLHHSLTGCAAITSFTFLSPLRHRNYPSSCNVFLNMTKQWVDWLTNKVSSLQFCHDDHMIDRSKLSWELSRNSTRLQWRLQVNFFNYWVGNCLLSMISKEKVNCVAQLNKMLDLVDLLL